MRSFVEKILLLGSIVALAKPLPVEESSQSASSNVQLREAFDKREDLPDVLNFDGIDWEQTNNLSVCSVDQRNILMETAKSIFDCLEGFFGGRVINKVPQPQYTWFGDHDARSVVERDWLKSIDGTYQHIQQAMRAAGDYPAMGNSNTKKKNRRVAFLCQPAERVPGHCAANTRLPAYTTKNDTDWPTSGHGYTITFCDSFFDVNRVFAKDLVNAQPTYSLEKLQTFGHIMYYEYMHVQWFGFSKKIVDVIVVNT